MAETQTGAPRSYSFPPTQRGATVTLGRVQLPYATPDSLLQELRDCNSDLEDPARLRERLRTQGYLFVRGLHDRDEVLAARQHVIGYLGSLDGRLAEGEPLEKGVLDARCGIGCVPCMEGRNDITHSKPILSVLEGPRPKAFFRRLFGEEPLTFDFKWLRAMHNEGFTGAHVDNVYMSRGTPELLTMWTPLGDVDMSMGTLAVCEGTNALESYARVQKTYAQLDVEAAGLKGSGWFTEDPRELSEQFGGTWKTTNFAAGDVLIFGMRTFHMSTANTSGLARVSCDTRWQPASQKHDPRYVGDAVGHATTKFGVYTDKGKAETPGKQEADTVTMPRLKAEWGFPTTSAAGEAWLGTV